MNQTESPSLEAFTDWECGVSDSTTLLPYTQSKGAERRERPFLSLELGFGGRVEYGTGQERHSR